MPNTPELSEAQRTLLEKYLRGAITRRASGSPEPLSFGQQQMLLLAQLAPDSPVYNECVIIHLPGPLDETALERSFNENKKSDSTPKILQILSKEALMFLFVSCHMYIRQVEFHIELLFYRHNFYCRPSNNELL